MFDCDDKQEIWAETSYTVICNKNGSDLYFMLAGRFSL